jgi:DNA adenine methylase
MQKPFTRIGGKSKTCKAIVNRIPQSDLFVEVFAGGASVFFKRIEKTKVEVINDLDECIYKIFDALQNQDVNASFPRSMTYEEFEDLKQKNKIEINGIHSLALSCYSFFGNQRSFKSKKGNTKYFKKDFTPYRERLKDVIIENLPFQDCIKKYDTTETVFYLDPPYENSKDYSNKVDPKDVYDVLQSIKGKFILSYNDSPTICMLFKKYNITKLNTIYEQSQNVQKRNVTELLITNF